MREVLRVQPDNIYEYGADYFAALLAEVRQPPTDRLEKLIDVYTRGCAVATEARSRGCERCPCVPVGERASRHLH